MYIYRNNCCISIIITRQSYILFSSIISGSAPLYNCPAHISGLTHSVHLTCVRQTHRSLLQYLYQPTATAHASWYHPQPLDICGYGSAQDRQEVPQTKETFEVWRRLRLSLINSSRHTSLYCEWGQFSTYDCPLVVHSHSPITLLVILRSSVLSFQTPCVRAIRTECLIWSSLRYYFLAQTFVFMSSAVPRNCHQADGLVERVGNGWSGL